MFSIISLDMYRLEWCSLGDEKFAMLNGPRGDRSDKLYGEGERRYFPLEREYNIRKLSFLGYESSSRDAGVREGDLCLLT